MVLVLMDLLYKPNRVPNKGNDLDGSRGAVWEGGDAVAGKRETRMSAAESAGDGSAGGDLALPPGSRRLGRALAVSH